MLSRKLAFCILHPQNRKLFELAKQHASATLVWQKNHPLFRPYTSSSTQPPITIEDDASQYEMELAVSGEMFPPFPTLYMPPPRSRPVLQTIVNVVEEKGDDEMYVMIEKDMFGADYYNSDV